MVLDGAELSYFGQEGMQEVVVGESKVIYVFFEIFAKTGYTLELGTCVLAINLF